MRLKGWPYQLKVNKLFSYGPGNIRENAKCVYICNKRFTLSFSVIARVNYRHKPPLSSMIASEMRKRTTSFDRKQIIFLKIITQLRLSHNCLTYHL